MAKGITEATVEEIKARIDLADLIASYGATVCAERSAIFAAVNAGERKLKAIAVTETPCGVCRQVMREFCDPKAFKVIVAKSAEDYKEYTLEELLPESFGPDHLI